MSDNPETIVEAAMVDTHAIAAQRRCGPRHDWTELYQDTDTEGLPPGWWAVRCRRCGRYTAAPTPARLRPDRLARDEGAEP